MKDYNYRTEEFELEVVTLKGKKRYYIQGYAATVDRDSVGDVITDSGQDKILSGLKGKKITLDVDHGDWFDKETGEQLKTPRGTIPVAKIIFAERRAKGVWVKAEINSNLSKFDELWGSITDKFLHSFSVAFYPIKTITRVVKGITTNLVHDLDLINITLTGAPINENATFNAVMKAVIKSESNKMGDDNNTKKPDVDASNVDNATDNTDSTNNDPANTGDTKPPVDDPKPPAKEGDKSGDTNNDANDNKDQLDVLKEFQTMQTEMKEMREQNQLMLDKLNQIHGSKDDSSNKPAIDTIDFNPLSGANPVIKSIRGELASLKAQNKKLNLLMEKPIFKSRISTPKSDDTKQEIKDYNSYSPLSTI